MNHSLGHQVQMSRIVEVGLRTTSAEDIFTNITADAIWEKIFMTMVMSRILKGIEDVFRVILNKTEEQNILYEGEMFENEPV